MSTATASWHLTQTKKVQAEHSHNFFFSLLSSRTRKRNWQPREHMLPKTPADDLSPRNEMAELKQIVFEHATLWIFRSAWSFDCVIKNSTAARIGWRLFYRAHTKPIQQILTNSRNFWHVPTRFLWGNIMVTEDRRAAKLFLNISTHTSWAPSFMYHLCIVHHVDVILFDKLYSFKFNFKFQFPIFNRRARDEIYNLTDST